MGLGWLRSSWANRMPLHLRITEVEKILLCNERGEPIKSYKGLSKSKLAKRYSMKKASDVENWLKFIGKANVLQPAITAALCQHVPFELVPEARTLVGCLRLEYASRCLASKYPYFFPQFK